jgi:serine/threonine protein kinase
VGFDFWALGVLLFEMMVGRMPFAPMNSEDAHGLFVSILMHAPRFPGGYCSGGFPERPLDEDELLVHGELEPQLPNDALTLIEGLLVKNPAERLGSAATGGWAAVKGHPFFSRGFRQG